MNSTVAGELGTAIPSASRGRSPVVLALDIGGTNIRVGRFENGRITAVTVHSSVRHGDSRSATDAMLSILESTADGDLASVDALGFAITGPLNLETGLVSNPHTLPGWSGTSWVEELRDQLGIPVIVENDAMGAAIGEFTAGAGRGSDVMCMVTLGTGVGVAVISASRGPYRGSRGFHPEGGHLGIGGRTAVCYCGLAGCWEEQCSGAGIRTYFTTLHGAVDWDAYGRTLARALRSLSRLFAPDRFVIGGGIAGNFTDFAPAMRAQLAAPDPMGIPEPLDIRAAELDYPGILGAAHLAIKALIDKEES